MAKGLDAFQVSGFFSTFPKNIFMKKLLSEATDWLITLLIFALIFWAGIEFGKMMDYLGY
jgi:hypothetical protein